MKVSLDFIVFLVLLFISIAINFQRSWPLFFILTLFCTGIFFVAYKIIRRFHLKKRYKRDIVVFYGAISLLVTVLAYIVIAFVGKFCGIDMYFSPFLGTNIITGKCSVVVHQCDGTPWYYQRGCNNPNEEIDKVWRDAGMEKPPSLY